MHDERITDVLSGRKFGRQFFVMYDVPSPPSTDREKAEDVVLKVAVREVIAMLKEEDKLESMIPDQPMKLEAVETRDESQTDIHNLSLE